jgi:hypothetical protein
MRDATVEEMLEAVFSMLSVLRCCNEDNWRYSSVKEFSVWSVNQRATT